MEGNAIIVSLLSDNTVVYVIIILLPVEKKWAAETTWSKGYRSALTIIISFYA